MSEANLVVVAQEQLLNVVGHDGHEVDHAHDGSHELAALGRRVQPQEVLQPIINSLGNY